MALNLYEVEVNGVTTHLQLSDEDAKAYPDAKRVGSVQTRESKSGARRNAEAKQAKAPANKATTAENK